MPELSVASLSSVKVPPIVAEAAQDIPNLRRHPRMLPAVKQNYMTNFPRSRPEACHASQRSGPEKDQVARLAKHDFVPRTPEPGRRCDFATPAPYAADAKSENTNW
jgi:hypothetical protein